MSIPVIVNPKEREDLDTFSIRSGALGPDLLFQRAVAGDVEARHLIATLLAVVARALEPEGPPVA